MNHEQPAPAQMRRQANGHQVFEDTVRGQRGRSDPALGRPARQIEAQLAEARKVRNNHTPVEVVFQQLSLPELGGTRGD